MNKAFLHITAFALLLISCGGPKETTGNFPREREGKGNRYITQFHKAVRFKATGRVDEAILAMEECLAMRKDDDAVYYALSELELMRNNEAKAAEYIQKAAELDPDNVWYTQEMAYMYFNVGDYPNAITQFEILVKKQPDNIDWLYGYSEVLRLNKDFIKAVDALNKTQDQIGLNPQLSIQKYQLYMMANQPEKGLSELMKAREVFPKDAQLIATLTDHYLQSGNQQKAREMLEELVKADPNNGRAKLALADLYQRQGKKDKVHELLVGALGSDDVDIDTKMKILMSMQETVFSEDEKMTELVGIMLEKYPNEAKAHSINGDYLMQIGKEEEALIAYRKALEYDKNQFPIWNQVLVMEYQLGKDNWLYEDSKECLDLFPTISTVYLLNGVSANLTGRPDEAIEVLSTGLELVINDTPLLAEFYGQLGDAYFATGEPSTAKEKYKKALELDPASLLLKNNFARKLADHKTDLALAKSLAKQVLDAAPGKAYFIDNYGWILFQDGKYEDALDQFEKAYGMNEEDPEIIEHLGDVNFKLNHLSKALEWWNMAAEMDPENTLLQRKISEKTYHEPR